MSIIEQTCWESSFGGRNPLDSNHLNLSDKNNDFEEDTVKSPGDSLMKWIIKFL